MWVDRRGLKAAQQGCKDVFNLKILDSGYFCLPSVGIKKHSYSYCAGRRYLHLLEETTGKQEAAEIREAV